jgi:hypothetical protein
LWGCLKRPLAADAAKKCFEWVVIILFRCRKRRISFETGSEEIFGHTAGLRPAVCPSRGQRHPSRRAFFEPESIFLFSNKLSLDHSLLQIFPVSVSPTCAKSFHNFFYYLSFILI